MSEKFKTGLVLTGLRCNYLSNPLGVETQFPLLTGFCNRVRENRCKQDTMIANDEIERNVILLVLSPEDIYERKLCHRELYIVANSLPEKQAKRIFAYLFLGMSKSEIARIESVNKSTITLSIEQVLKSIQNHLKNFC